MIQFYLKRCKHIGSEQFKTETYRYEGEVSIVVVVDGGVDGDGLRHVRAHIERGRGPDPGSYR